MTITSSTPPMEVQEEKTMHLVERMQVKPSEELSKLCHKSKDMYNKANYIMRHYFLIIRESEQLAKEWLKKINNYLVSCPHGFDKIVTITDNYLKKTKKETREGRKKGNLDWYYHEKLRISYTRLERMLKFSPEYERMPSHTAQRSLMKIVDDWEGYCKKTNKYYKKKKELNPREFKKRYPIPPNIPGYKKKDGETIAYFTDQQCRIRDGILRFPGYTRSPKSPRWLPPMKVRYRGKLNLVEIVPKGAAYIIGIIYVQEKEEYRLDETRVASIDLGVRNIVTMVNNIGLESLVVKGGVVKSINQYYNKIRAILMSMKDRQGYKHWTRKLHRLGLTRYNKLHDIFHKLSRHIIKYCVDNDIGTLVIGYNPLWKQKSNMGKKNNQNFVSIPFWKLIEKIQYKAELIGIKVVLEEEPYTSICSFFDRETIGKHKRYKGKRLSRGLFRASDGRIINADVNAAFNIMRKAIPEVQFADGIEDIVLHPRCVSWY